MFRIDNEYVTKLQDFAEKAKQNPSGAENSNYYSPWHQPYYPYPTYPVYPYCPGCGRCPVCGRGGHYCEPSYPIITCSVQSNS